MSEWEPFARFSSCTSTRAGVIALWPLIVDLLRHLAMSLYDLPHRQDDLRNASPRSSVLSLPRSHAGTSAGGSRAPSVRSSGATGPKKVDRVKRYQELQQGWSKDKCVVAARAGTAG